MNRKNIISVVKTFFRVILGGLLIIAGVLKVQDNSALFESVAYITWLPLWFKSIVIDTLPWVEILIGGLLIAHLFNKIVVPAAGLIYAVFFIFAIYGLGSGLEGDCGCFGEMDDSSWLGALLGSEFGWKMVIRNGIFVTMAGFLFWRPGKVGS